MSTVPVSPHLFKPDPLPLTLQLREDGWAPGFPAFLTCYSVAVDVWAVKQMLCPSCKRKRMQATPFFRGEEYVCVAVCKCGAQEEF